MNGTQSDLFVYAPGRTIATGLPSEAQCSRSDDRISPLDTIQEIPPSVMTQFVPQTTQYDHTRSLPSIPSLPLVSLPEQKNEETSPSPPPVTLPLATSTAIRRSHALPYHPAQHARVPAGRPAMTFSESLEGRQHKHRDLIQIPVSPSPPPASRTASVAPSATRSSVIRPSMLRPSIARSSVARPSVVRSSVAPRHSVVRPSRTVFNNPSHSIVYPHVVQISHTKQRLHTRPPFQSIRPSAVLTMPSPDISPSIPSVHTRDPSVHTRDPSVHTRDPSVHARDPSVHTRDPSSNLRRSVELLTTDQLDEGNILGRVDSTPVAFEPTPSDQYESIPLVGVVSTNDLLLDPPPTSVVDSHPTTVVDSHPISPEKEALAPAEKDPSSENIDPSSPEVSDPSSEIDLIPTRDPSLKPTTLDAPTSILPKFGLLSKYGMENVPKRDTAVVRRAGFVFKGKTRPVDSLPKPSDTFKLSELEPSSKNDEPSLTRTNVGVLTPPASPLISVEPGVPFSPVTPATDVSHLLKSGSVSPYSPFVPKLQTLPVEHQKAPVAIVPPGTVVIGAPPMSAKHPIDRIRQLSRVNTPIAPSSPLGRSSYIGVQSMRSQALYSPETPPQRNIPRGVIPPKTRVSRYRAPIAPPLPSAPPPRVPVRGRLGSYY